MGFNNPIVGGTALRIPAIQSPNYSPGVSGWIIKINGDAEFNNLTIRGEFIGTRFIINSSGIFLYSGTPAAGNLIGSWASVAGTDAFTNTYPAGLRVQDSSGRQVDLAPTGALRVNDTTVWDNGASLSAQPSLAAFGFSTILQSATDNSAPGNAATAIILDPGDSDGSPHGTVKLTSPGTGVEVDLDLSGNVTVGGVDTGRGVRSKVALTSNVTGITGTETVLMTIPSMTFVNGRAYRVSLWGLAQSSTASTYYLYRVRKGSATTTGTIYKDLLRIPVLGTANTDSVVNMVFNLVNNSGADITTALTWTASMAAGTGQFSASSSNVAHATVEDVGLSSAWPGSPVT